MQNITLSVQTINAVMSYLGTKPFQEVFQIIEAIQKEVSAQQEPVQHTENPDHAN
jgi:hypothetical protein